MTIIIVAIISISSLNSGVAIGWVLSTCILSLLLLAYMKVFKLDKLTWPGNLKSCSFLISYYSFIYHLVFYLTCVKKSFRQ